MDDEQPPLPGLEPPPQPPALVAPSARVAVESICDKLAVEDIPVSRAAREIVGRHAKTLLEDGFPLDIVVMAGTTAVRRGDVKVMQLIAQDLVLARSGMRMTRRQYEQALQDVQELRGKT